MVWPSVAWQRHFRRGQWKVQEGKGNRRRLEDNINEWTQMEWRFPEGSGRRGRVERYCCNVICGAPMTAEVEGLRDELTKLIKALSCLLFVTFSNVCTIRQKEIATAWMHADRGNSKKRLTQLSNQSLNDIMLHHFIFNYLRKCYW